MGTREFCLRRALQLTAKYPEPKGRRPRGSRLIFFAVTFAGVDLSGDVHADGVNASHVAGRGWDAGQTAYVRPVQVPFTQACEALTELRFGFRDYTFRSDDPVRFMLDVWSGRFRFRAWKIDRRLGAYQRRNRERRSRMAVLRRLIELSIGAGGDEGVRPIDLLDVAADEKWFYHPGHLELAQYIRFLLDSLVIEGLANRGEHGYVIEPAAFAALDAFDTEGRRHADNRRLQRLLAFIGLLALIGSLAQAVAAVKQTWYPDLPRVERAHGTPVATLPSCGSRSARSESTL